MTPHLSVLRLTTRLLPFLPIPGVVAATAYLLSLAPCLYPGYSAFLAAAAVGVIPPSGAAHPVFAFFARHVASLDYLSLPLRLNLFSACCGTLCTMLLYYLVSRLILFSACEDAGGAGRVNITGQDDEQEDGKVSELPPEVTAYNQRMVWIAVTGGLIAAVLFTFTAAAWAASTRLDNGMFDLLTALVSLALFPVGYPRLRLLRLLLSVFFFATGLFESAVFLLLLPFYAYIVFDLLVFSPRRVARFMYISAVGVAALSCSAYAFVANSCHASSWTIIRAAHAYARALIGHHYHEALSFFPRSGWLLLALQIGLPAVILLFGMRTLFKEKKASTVIALVILTGSVLPGLLNVFFAPIYIFQDFGHLPVFGYAVLAAAAAVGFSACRVVVGRGEEHLTHVEISSSGESERQRRLQWVSGFAFALLPVLLALIIATPWRSRGSVDNQRGAFADHVARVLLETMKARTCLITNGILDNHIRIQAFMMGRQLHLIPLRISAGSQEEALVRQFVVSNPLFEGQNRQRYLNALSLGGVRFAMEWLSSDINAGRQVMVFAAPDLWVACGYRAVPEGLAFGGARAGEASNLDELAEWNRAFSERVAPLLDATKTGQGGFVDDLRETIRMKLGFSANELGVLLEEHNKYKQAYQSYMRALDIDPMNVSAIINAYALASSQGLYPETLDAMRKRVKTALIKARASSGQNVTAIIQNYGSIRQQAFYQQQTAQWAVRGARQIAEEKIKKALSLSSRTGVSSLVENAMVSLYAGDVEKAEASYRAALEQDASNADALVGMCTLMIGKRSVSESEKWIQKTLGAGVEPSLLRYQTVMLAVLKKDTSQALSLLTEATKKCPTDLRYWTLLADQLLSQGDTQMVEFQILPEMQKALKNANHFLVHSVRGFLLQKKGAKFYREARVSLLSALALNAALPDIWNAVFELDQALNNPDFTEADARALLRVEPNHALANYLLGALLLARGELLASEDFLRRSVEKKPTAAACNDLAENLRLQKKPAEAEVFARRALEMDRNLLPAMDTLANIQCDAGNFGEAMKWASQTVAEKANNPYYQLTLLRVLVKKGDQEGVRERLKILGELKTAVPLPLQKEIAELNRTATK